MSLQVSSCAMGQSSPLDQSIEALIGELETDSSTQKLADDLSKKMKQLDQLLSEYILAKMSGQDTNGILTQIDQQLKAIQTEVQNFDTVRNGLKTIENNPSSWNLNTLATLESYKSLLT